MLHFLIIYYKKMYASIFQLKKMYDSDSSNHPLFIIQGAMIQKI